MASISPAGILSGNGKLIGYLPTGFEFLDGTLEENIIIGRDRSQIEHFEEALRLSGEKRFWPRTESHSNMPSVV